MKDEDWTGTRLGSGWWGGVPERVSWDVAWGYRMRGCGVPEDKSWGGEEGDGRWRYWVLGAWARLAAGPGEGEENDVVGDWAADGAGD